MLEDTNTKFLHNIASGLEIVVSNFQRDVFISAEVIAFFTKVDFCHFTYIVAYNSRTTNNFQNLIISRERTFEDPTGSLYVLF